MSEGNNIEHIINYISEPMPSESREIRIYIKPSDVHSKDVSITTLADFFQHIQKILYQVCDEVVENEYRTTGRYPDFIKENCNLVLKSVKLNSADIAVAISHPQTALPFPDINKTIGERAIGKTNEIFEIVREKDNIFPDLSPVISDEGRRYHILSEINAIWPDESSNYHYEIGIGEKRLKGMSPIRKPVIRRALERGIIQSERTFFGRLVELDVTKKHSCQIETEAGKINCKYTPNLTYDVEENIGKFVAISGEMLNSNTISLTSEFGLQRIDVIPIKQIIVDDNPKDLKKEIELSFNYDKENDEYSVFNEQMNIFSINNRLDSAIQDIKEQIGILWIEFVEEDIRNLTESAIEFRKNLIDFVGEN